MTDDELMEKLNAQRTPTNSFDNTNFEPIKEGVKKACPCNSKSDTNTNINVSKINSNESGFTDKIGELFDIKIGKLYHGTTTYFDKILNKEIWLSFDVTQSVLHAVSEFYNNMITLDYEEGLVYNIDEEGKKYIDVPLLYNFDQLKNINNIMVINSVIMKELSEFFNISVTIGDSSDYDLAPIVMDKLKDYNINGWINTDDMCQLVLFKPVDYIEINKEIIKVKVKKNKKRTKDDENEEVHIKQLEQILNVDTLDKLTKYILDNKESLSKLENFISTRHKKCVNDFINFQTNLKIEIKKNLSIKYNHLKDQLFEYNTNVNSLNMRKEIEEHMKRKLCNMNLKESEEYLENCQNSMEKYVQVCILNCLRPVIYKMIIDIQKKLKGCGKIVVGGRENANLAVKPNERVISTDIDTKLFLNFKFPLDHKHEKNSEKIETLYYIFKKKFTNKMFYEILPEIIDMYTTYYPKHIYPLLNKLQNTFEMKIFDIKFPKENEKWLRKRFTLLESEIDKLLDDDHVELFVIDMIIPSIDLPDTNVISGNFTNQSISYAMLDMPITNRKGLQYDYKKYITKGMKFYFGNNNNQVNKAIRFQNHNFSFIKPKLNQNIHPGLLPIKNIINNPYIQPSIIDNILTTNPNIDTQTIDNYNQKIIDDAKKYKAEADTAIEDWNKVKAVADNIKAKSKIHAGLIEKKNKLIILEEKARLKAEKAKEKADKAKNIADYEKINYNDPRSQLVISHYPNEIIEDFKQLYFLNKYYEIYDKQRLLDLELRPMEKMKKDIKTIALLRSTKCKANLNEDHEFFESKKCIKNNTNFLIDINKKYNLDEYLNNNNIKYITDCDCNLTTTEMTNIMNYNYESTLNIDNTHLSTGIAKSMRYIAPMSLYKLMSETYPNKIENIFDDRTPLFNKTFDYITYKQQKKQKQFLKNKLLQLQQSQPQELQQIQQIQQIQQQLQQIDTDFKNLNAEYWIEYNLTDQERRIDPKKYSNDIKDTEKGTFKNIFLQTLKEYTDSILNAINHIYDTIKNKTSEYDKLYNNPNKYIGLIKNKIGKLLYAYPIKDNIDKITSFNIGKGLDDEMLMYLTFEDIFLDMWKQWCYIISKQTFLFPKKRYDYCYEITNNLINIGLTDKSLKRMLKGEKNPHNIGFNIERFNMLLKSMNKNNILVDQYENNKGIQDRLAALDNDMYDNSDIINKIGINVKKGTMNTYTI